MRVLILLALGLAAVVAAPGNQQRIAGGSDVHINRYPYMVAMLYSQDLVWYNQECGGIIITSRTILSVAQCFHGDPASRWRGRVGSSYRGVYGIVHGIEAIINHESYNPRTLEHDLAVLRTFAIIDYSSEVAAASIAGSNYNLADNQVVWTAGWGRLRDGGPVSEQLQHVQIWTVNQATCRERYASVGQTVTGNMLCSGWLDVGGRDACPGDYGGPLLHNGVVVGVTSWGRGCAQARFPSVNTRVSSYTAWIQSKAQS